MSTHSLAELAASAVSADDPAFVSAADTRFGGVDPLGLRQINFDLMDRVFPGLNNVARHVRPFVVVTWAWRRAQQIAQRLGSQDVTLGQLEDFVDRIEVVFAWSQFLNDAAADLPGRDFLAPIVQAQHYTFGGLPWEKLRKTRRYSTALSAPVNYGPGLRMLGWVYAHPEFPGVMVPNPAVAPALDALDALMSGMLPHHALSSFGSVVVTRDDAQAWAGVWTLNDPSAPERAVMRDLLMGHSAPAARRRGCELMVAAAGHTGSIDPDVLRAAMSGAPSDFDPPASLVETRDAWRRVQIRQLFRLSLEATLYWIMHRLQGGATSSMSALVAVFIEDVAVPAHVRTAGAWIDRLRSPQPAPTALMADIREALEEPTSADLPRTIVTGLAFCLSATDLEPADAQQRDRLPLARARQEAAARAEGSVGDFVRHVLESWVLAQHTYWSVGRGLADARARGRMLLRLKIVLDEGGWSLTPGASAGGAPRPTPDRLWTAISVARECRLFTESRAL